MVRYHAKHDRIELTMAHGWSLVIDRKAIEELAHVPPAQMKEMGLSPAGTALHLEKQGIHISVEGLIVSLMPRSLFARIVGQRGGAAKSAAKASASRRNGLKGGRPRKEKRAASS